MVDKEYITEERFRQMAPSSKSWYTYSAICELLNEIRIQNPIMKTESVQDVKILQTEETLQKMANEIDTISRTLNDLTKGDEDGTMIALDYQIRKLLQNYIEQEQRYNNRFDKLQTRLHDESSATREQLREYATAKETGPNLHQKIMTKLETLEKAQKEASEEFNDFTGWFDKWVVRLFSALAAKRKDRKVKYEDCKQIMEAKHCEPLPPF